MKGKQTYPKTGDSEVCYLCSKSENIEYDGFPECWNPNDRSECCPSCGDGAAMAMIYDTQGNVSSNVASEYEFEKGRH